jgi:putative flippase GtrA
MYQPRNLAKEVRRFLLVGVVGFLIDAALLVLAHDLLMLEWPIARLVSFIAAATVTWLLNRSLTFAARAGRATIEQWRRYVAVNGAGAALNLTVFMLLIYLAPPLADRPIVALALAAAVALAFNFLGTRAIVFKLDTTAHRTAKRHE